MSETETPAESVMLDIGFTLNGIPWSGNVRTEAMLLELLRDQIGLTGTKRSCESQVCGACTVLVDSQPVSSCTYLALEAGGKDVLTIEGLEHDGRLDVVQEQFLYHEGFQCGFCTSGMIMMAKALLSENPSPTRNDVAKYLRGNICRCGAYTGILGAILDAATA